MAIITAANLKAHLGIPDSDDDVTIGYAVNAANQSVTEHCGRTFDKTAAVDASVRVYFPGCSTHVYVDDFWETSALVVKTDEGNDGTYETTWVLNTDFFLEPLNGLQHGQARPYNKLVAMNRSFPIWGYRPSLQVTAAWGWPAHPGAVFEATLIHATRIFKRKSSPEGVLGGWSEFGAVRVSSRMDPDVRDLLAPFRHPDLVAMVG